MKLLKFMVFAVTMVSGSIAFSDTMTCRSVNDLGAPNQFVVEAKFERTFFKGHAREGSFSYSRNETGAGTSIEKGQVEFACREPNDKGIVFCGVTSEPDKNIRRIVQHPKLGFLVQFTDSPGVTLFDCRTY